MVNLDFFMCKNGITTAHLIHAYIYYLYKNPEGFNDIIYVHYIGNIYMHV